MDGMENVMGRFDGMGVLLGLIQQVSNPAWIPPAISEVSESPTTNVAEGS